MKATLNTSWELYTKYQIAIHKEEPDECCLSSYSEFLVNSPLKVWLSGQICFAKAFLNIKGQYYSIVKIELDLVSSSQVIRMSMKRFGNPLDILITSVEGLIRVGP